MKLLDSDHRDRGEKRRTDPDENEVSRIKNQSQKIHPAN